MDNSYADFPALHKNRWVCFFVHNVLTSDPELLRFTAALNLEIISENLAEKFIFSKGKSEEVLVLTYNTTHYKSELFLKSKIYKAFENFYKEHPQSIYAHEDLILPSNKHYVFKELNIDVEENFLHYGISKGGWKIFNRVTVDLMHKVSTLICHLIRESEDEWSIESGIQKQIPLFLILLNSFEFDRNELSAFLDWFWGKMILNIDLTGVQDTTEWHRIFFDNINLNYESQQNFFSAYSEYILDALDTQTELDEEWLNEWKVSCINAYRIFTECLNQDFFVKDDIDSAHDSPKWLFAQTIIHNIHNMLGVNMVYEYNITYSLKEALKVSTPPYSIE